MSRVLRFTATWCGPCKMLAKTLEKIETNLPIEVCDIDAVPEMAQQYGVRGVPTLILLDDEGKEVKRLVGGKPEAELRKWLGE